MAETAATDSTLEVQKAIVALLRGDAGVAALVGARVYDQAPASVAFPFVSLGPTLGQPAVETDGGEGFEVSVTLDVWSRSRAGRVEAAQIMGAVVAAMNNAEPALDSKTVVMLRLESQRLMLDPDGVTHHGVQRWTVVTDG